MKRKNWDREMKRERETAQWTSRNLFRSSSHNRLLRSSTHTPPSLFTPTDSHNRHTHSSLSLHTTDSHNRHTHSFLSLHTTDSHNFHTHSFLSLHTTDSHNLHTPPKRSPSPPSMQSVDVPWTSAPSADLSRRKSARPVTVNVSTSSPASTPSPLLPHLTLTQRIPSDPRL